MSTAASLEPRTAESSGSERRTATSLANRLQRPSWKDPRLIVGVVVVLLSVLGVVALVAAQDRTTPVYVADRALSSGDRLTQEDLRVVYVRLDEAGDQYLPVEDSLPEYAQLMRAVGEGELVPRQALGDADPGGRQPLTVEVQHDLARAVQPGRAVDIWESSAVTLAEGSAEVARLVAGAEVIDIRETTSAFGAQSAVTVEVLIAPEEISTLLAATGSGSSLSVLPASETEPREADLQDASR